jgi:transcriptional regulator with XRE-family HTH domain
MKRSDLGQRIYSRRLQLGMSQERIAQAAQMDLACLRRFEEQPDLPTTSTLIRLAAALQTTMPELLGYVERNLAGAGRTVRPAHRTARPKRSQLEPG